MFEPMLAHASSTVAPSVDAALTALSAGGYQFEVKWDGVRCLAFVNGGRVKLRGRSGSDLTAAFPEIVEALSWAFPEDEVVLDGELIVFTKGTVDFPAAHRRALQGGTVKIAAFAKTSPATFMAFDVLSFDDVDQRDTRQKARSATLAALNVWQRSPQLALTPVSLDGPALWEFVTTHNLEGIIAKRLLGRYTGKRSTAWIKLKRTHRATCIVTGYDKGEGGRAGQVGALHLALQDTDATLVPVGKVGTGFTARDHKTLLGFLPGRFFVDVEFMALTADRQLRMPSYRGINTSATLADCNFNQVS